MDIIINLILIQIIVVNIVDVSGFVDTVKNALKKWLRIKGEITIKPFDCSYCLNWWIGMIYLVCVGELTLYYIPFVLLLSMLTNVTLSLQLLLKDILATLINLIYKMIDRIK